MDENDKRVISESVSKLYSGVDKSVDEGRLKSMPDTAFEREVDDLSIEILMEIGELKKRFYEEGFKDALKQMQAQQIVASSLHEHNVSSVTSVTPDSRQPGSGSGVSHFDSKMEDLDQKLEEYSARIAALEQMVLTYGSRDEELKQVIGENKELVNTLKDRLTEISVIQSSIEEKVSQPQAESVSEDQFTALRKDIDHLGELIVEDGSKMNRIENARKTSVRRLDRKFKSLQKHLEDFKKVRKQLRKQGKRITKISDETVAKTSFTTTVKRLRAAKAVTKKAKPRRKATTIGVSGGKRTQVVVTTKLASSKSRKASAKSVRKTAKPKASHKRTTKATAARKSTVTVSSAAPTTVEINQKK